MLDSIDVRERTATPRSQRAKFRSSASSTDRCEFFKDTTGRFVRVNAAFCRWLGRPEAEILGRDAFDLWPPAVAEALAAADRRVLSGECVEREEECPNGRELRTLKTVQMPVRDAQGIVIGVLGHFVDVTEDRHPDETQRPSLRRLVLGQMTTSLASEINQLRLLTREYAAQFESGVLEQLESAVGTASALTQRLIVFSRAEEETLEPADLNAVLTEVTNHFRAIVDRRVVIDVRTSGGLPSVRAPYSQLVQIVLNLCLNARAAMPAGGRLSIETDLVQRESCPTLSKTSCSESGRYVRLRITDTGKVMSRERRGCTFDPWHSTKANGKGNGLGLAVVQDVVRRHGGWITCTRAVGPGTCFSAFFPAHDQEVDALPLPNKFRSPESATVLLVDNEPNIVSLFQTILQRNGFRVHAARSGREALDIHRRERGQIGVVVMDQYMPGMSGLDVVGELAATDPYVRVLLMSGAPLDNVPVGLARNLCGFLAKPFRAEQLLKAVRESLAGRCCAR